MDYRLHIILANGAKWAEDYFFLKNRNNMGEEKKYIFGNNLRNFNKQLIAVAFLIALLIYSFDEELNRRLCHTVFVRRTDIYTCLFKSL